MKLNYDLLIRYLYANSQRDPLHIAASAIQNPNKDEWPYIQSNPGSIAAFLRDIEASKVDLQGKRFMDAGCGYPFMLRLMSMFGCYTYGIESNHALKILFPELIGGDMLLHDYKDYDIIYSYNPIKNGMKMAKGIRRIVKTMKPGAIFYFVDAHAHRFNCLKIGFTCVSYNVLKYIKPEKKLKTKL